MSEPTKNNWRIVGEQVVSCNCNWGCPCQFNALPTTGRCEGIGAYQINEGYFGNTRLDGVCFAGVKIPTGMPQLPTGNVFKWKLNCDRFATGGAGKSFFGRDYELKVNKLLAHNYSSRIEGSTGRIPDG